MNPFDKITAGDAKPKKEIKHIVTSKTHDGKILHTHVHHHPEHHPDEHHVSMDNAEVGGHFEKHNATPNEGEAAPMAPPDGGEAPAQMTASPSPMPAPGA